MEKNTMQNTTIAPGMQKTVIPKNDNVPEMKEYLKPILFSGADRFLQAHNWLMDHPGTEVWDVDCHEWDDMPGITLYYVAEMPADDYEALKRMKEKQKVAVKQRRADHDD